MTTQAVSGRRYFTKAWLLEQKSLIALLVLIAIVSTLSPNFFTVNNLFNILQQTSVNAIMAVGMTLVILTSGIDLSVGSLLALTGAVAASIVGVEVNALVAVAAALALGAAIGAHFVDMLVPRHIHFNPAFTLKMLFQRDHLFH